EPEPALAPQFEIGTREVVAVEHPAIIQNLDNGIKTFGDNQPFERIINCTDPEECIPLYLRFRDPTCPPILSQSTSTQNIVLKITVPKRTGRRRKKGSQDPFTKDAPWEDDEPREPELCSHSRMDTSLWRRLQDNIGKYTCEAVAEIKQTHRFRGLADFHQSTTHMPFFSKFRDTALTGNIEKMREFKFDTSRGPKPNEEIIMPTNITPYSLPFNWSWQQNPHISQETDPVTGKPILVNTSRLERLQVVYLPHYMENIPEGPSQEPPDDQDVLQIIENIKELYNARPIWTRRAIINKVNYAVTEATLHLIRLALPYIGYRFRDGPFKDAIIQFGLDPRKDPKYRMYQTIYFQLAEREVRDPNAPWTGTFKPAKTPKRAKRSNDKLSHFFDGRDVAVDGKIWQMCDVTDPLLAKLIKEAPISETFDAKNDGWFCNGTLAKIRAIMKVKMIALHTGRVVKDEDFKKALEMPDIIPDREGGRVWIPVPDMRLSKEEMEKLRASGKDFTIMSGM
ncbi:RNA polymerase III transcription factor IIIC subunit-domain-containing protein, partial [Hyaloscypha finlandica]